MKKISLTQGLYALVDDADYAHLSRWPWCAKRDGRTFYAARGRRKADGPGPGLIAMHREILQPLDGLQTDHVNGNGLDNRRANLRAVTRAANSANRTGRNRNRKYDLPLGVIPSGRGFVARIGIDGYQHYLGTFDTPEEASAAYLAARERRIADAAPLFTQEAEV